MCFIHQALQRISVNGLRTKQNNTVLMSIVKGRGKEVVCIHNYEKLDKLEKRKDFLLIHKQAMGHQVHRL
jgi:hypothetical protein